MLFGDVDTMWDVHAEALVKIQVGAGFLPLVRLYDINNREIGNRSFVQRQGQNLIISIRFPEPGSYLVKLYLKNKTDAPDVKYRAVVSIPFQARAGTNQGYPYQYILARILDCQLVSPLQTPLPVNTKLTFAVTVPFAERVSIKIGAEYIDLTRYENDNFIAELELPAKRVILGMWEQQEFKPLYYWE